MGTKWMERTLEWNFVFKFEIISLLTNKFSFICFICLMMLLHITFIVHVSKLKRMPLTFDLCRVLSLERMLLITYEIVWLIWKPLFYLCEHSNVEHRALNTEYTHTIPWDYFILSFLPFPSSEYLHSKSMIFKMYQPPLSALHHFELNELNVL